MNIFIIILAGLSGLFLGRMLAQRRAASKNTAPPARPAAMAAMRKKAARALSARTQKREEILLAHVRMHGRITNDEAEELLCVSDSTARRYLDEMEHAGLLRQEGETGRGVAYVPAAQTPQTTQTLPN